MVKLFIGLGVGVFVAGAVAVAMGLPYVVLERGFTQVIVGAVGMNAGLVLIGIGVVLREIRKQQRSVMAGMSPVATAGDARQADANAVAPLAVAAAAVTGAAAATSTGAEAAADRLSQPEFDWPKRDTPPAEQEPRLSLPEFELPPLDLPGINLSPVDDRPLADTADMLGDVPGQDEFTRLRAALSDQLERRDRPDAGTAQADLAEPDAGLDVEADNADGPSEDTDVAVDEAEFPTIADVVHHDSPEPDAADADSEAAALPPARPTRDVVSDEGVVRAYQVGDTAFTIYGDGTIRAETREGEYTFQSMEEVRAFLMQEKLRVRV